MYTYWYWLKRNALR